MMRLGAIVVILAAFALSATLAAADPPGGSPPGPRAPDGVPPGVIIPEQAGGQAFEFGKLHHPRALHGRLGLHRTRAGVDRDGQPP